MSTETVALRMGFRADQALAIEETCLRFGIDTTQRKSHFLGQLAHESATGRYMEEIASGRAYEGRADLGNSEPGDGVRFKGRGLIQLTGRANYAAYSRDVHGDARAVRDPGMVARLPDAALAAGWFWRKKGLNALADTGSVRAVTRRVNGGYNGLADREAKTALSLSLFEGLLRANR